MPILSGDVAATREWVFTDYRPRFPRIPESTYVRDRRYKLYDDGRFFDVANDVLEEHPLPVDTLVADALLARTALHAVLDSMQSINQ